VCGRGRVAGSTVGLVGLLRVLSSWQQKRSNKPHKQEEEEEEEDLKKRKVVCHAKGLKHAVVKKSSTRAEGAAAVNQLERK